MALRAEADAVEKRMQDLCEYKFKGDPEIAPILALLRPGKSHQDLANDLVGYANVYELRAAEVLTDTTNYRPTDVADARRLAGEILATLSSGMTPAARASYDVLRRVWTVLLDVYDEVQKAGALLCRVDPDVATRFPSLITLGRAAPRPRKPKTPPNPTPPPAS